MLGQPYCNGITNGGTHWMWYITEVYAVVGTNYIQFDANTTTWKDVIVWLVANGAIGAWQVDTSMTLEEINDLPNLNGVQYVEVGLSDMLPCVCG